MKYESFTFRTKPPKHYLAPSAEEMQEVAKKVGLKSFSRDFVADLANLAAGGAIQAPSKYRKIIRKKVEERGIKTSSDGEYEMPKGADYTWEKSQYKALDAHTAKEMSYHQNVCDFLESVDISRFPGETPLTQTMSMLKMLSLQKGGASEGGSNGGEILPIFQEDDDNPPGSIKKKLYDQMETVASLTEEELDMLDPEREEVLSVLSKLKIAEELATPNKALMLKVSRKLDQFSKMKSRKTKIEKPNSDGNEMRTRGIEHLGELPQINKPEWATYRKSKKLFMYKAVTGQTPLRERITKEERKQAIFILVDGSGSMSGTKHYKASGVIMNRLKAVIEGNAEVFVSVFDTEMGEVNKATSKEEAKELIKKFTNGNFDGGGTDIAEAVKSAHQYMEDKVKEGAMLCRPEIVVLTDEDSSADGVKKSDIKGSVVHGFAMETNNPNLVALAASTGGVGRENF